ncbi:Splicing factor [Yamadazyma tenuis]|uniref:RRM domain-containing protein n=1 Tax=Candida tenuis (strain ATCC 10573 / BCRC 21748 / CBS 615 / JCM 9827 / NBRC 10315 / NRRL Y-1498 / VKM Y-70) TaxID=590646 RepID=G3BCF8_CANTC|nr:uncharacterized protein CANTEDRAFT_96267 [Yamadazyma tenuis ATCC 10573]EGV60824.1 hypothetical protein CANTEDRAFT_96267 [Yamadazyma tenuis ATCC 10573]WEJ93905.1 Splicing factor [Yamadazyma tenuis]
MDIEELQQRVQEQPFELSQHDTLISALRLHKTTKVLDLYQARVNKLEYFTLRHDEINEILEDLMAIDDKNTRIELVDGFYNLLIREYPTSSYWLRYLDFASQVKSHSELHEMYTRALNDTVHDFENSHLIWNKVLEFFTEIPEGSTPGSDQIQMWWKLHIKRLSYPHNKLEQSFSDTSEFVSVYFPDKYDEFMTMASEVHGTTQRSQIYYEKHEVHLTSKHKDPDFWARYLADVGKYSTDLRQVSTLFYRSLMSAVSDWVPVWTAYIFLLYSKDDNTKFLMDILPKFVCSFPGAFHPYVEYIRNMELFDEPELYDRIRDRIEYMKLLNPTSQGWQLIATTILSFENRVESPRLLGDVKRFFTGAVADNSVVSAEDNAHSVEKICISIYESRGLLEEAKHLVSKLTLVFGGESAVWIYALRFFERNHFKYEDVSRFLHTAIAAAVEMDSPVQLINEALLYEQVYGTRISLQKAVVRANIVYRTINEKKAESEDEDTQWNQSAVAEFVSTPGVTTRKRPLDTHEPIPKKVKIDKPTRNREELSVKVTGLPANVPECTVEQFFQDCGVVRNVVVFHSGEGCEAVVEFEDNQAIFAALTKSHKKLENQEVLVKRMSHCILWVCNFPPSMDKTKLIKVFEPYGTVIDVRLPFQNSQHRQRRFAYIEYAEGEQARAAVSQLNGKMLHDDLNDSTYKLVAKFSDNSAERGPPVFKRQIYVGNIPYDTTTAQVREFFQVYGRVENVTLPISTQTKERGHMNSGYGFVLFQSETSIAQALTADGSSFRDRIIKVSASKPSQVDIVNELRPFNHQSSLALYQVPKTATREQLSLYFKQTTGVKPTRITIFPDKEAAAVQFASTSESGKAGLAIQSHQFNSTFLKADSLDTLTSSVPREAPVPSPGPKRNYFIPASVQRR